MKSHITHLNKLVKEARTALPIVAALLVERVAEIERKVRLDDVRKQVEGWFKTTTALACILPILEVNAQLHGILKDEPGNWPRDFLEAMMKEDRREWVSA